jgi:hypothetical protein
VTTRRGRLLAEHPLDDQDVVAVLENDADLELGSD